LQLLKRLCVAPTTETALNGSLYITDAGERVALRGGSWYYAAHAGLGYLNLVNGRSNSYSIVGFFSAFAG
jgi:hypothetical protein